MQQAIYCPDCANTTSGDCGGHGAIVTQPFLCPVCLGRRQVPNGFYSRFGMDSSIVVGSEPCRSCQETGIVWP